MYIFITHKRIFDKIMKTLLSNNKIDSLWN